MSPLPELVSNLNWLVSNPIDLKELQNDIFAWASVPHIKAVLYELLALLKRHGISVTFFVSGVCAEQNKTIIRHINEAGHEIGLHGYRHVPYDMEHEDLMVDVNQAVSVFEGLGIEVKGFRAPWLISNKNAYVAAELLGLNYVSNIKAKKGLQRLEDYSFVELPIFLDDESLLLNNAVEVLLNSSGSGRVFGFHLLYVRKSMHVLDEFLSRLKVDAVPLSKIADGYNGLGLSFDIAYLSRLELVKKLFF